MTRLHILGICGTFMGGVAALAKEKGMVVSGQDAGVYPPMSALLAELGIGVCEGYAVGDLPAASELLENATEIVIGNALSRGNEAVEAVLNQGFAYTSGAAWLGAHVLPGRETYAVAGTHGKTSTSSMLAWIFEQAGQSPGFLIGGKPGNFEHSARLGSGAPFVVEADEYDTAFFDKRSKFVHYRPKVAILNNLEFDHADIFADLAAIQAQFHHLVRSVPGNGQLIVNADEPHLADVLKQGSWTPISYFSVSDPAANWYAKALKRDATEFTVYHQQVEVGTVRWQAPGVHNMSNALAAISAAQAGGVSVADACAALTTFALPAKRLQRHDNPHGIMLYEDFAHHPTAIEKTLATLRARHPGQRLIAVLEPRSNTMKMGVHRATLADALIAADRIYFASVAPIAQVMATQPAHLYSFDNADAVYQALMADIEKDDVVAVMSNGDFGGLVRRLSHQT